MKNNKNYRYKLDPSSRKTKCPNCGQKSFVGMIDSETGEFLQDYGRCDREEIVENRDSLKDLTLNIFD